MARTSAVGGITSWLLGDGLTALSVYGNLQSAELPTIQRADTLHHNASWISLDASELRSSSLSCLHARLLSSTCRREDLFISGRLISPTRRCQLQQRHAVLVSSRPASSTRRTSPRVGIRGTHRSRAWAQYIQLALSSRAGEVSPWLKSEDWAKQRSAS